MFESIRIKNFRSIRDSGELELADINVLVGLNNSGKSSVLYALMMLKMTLESKSKNAVLVTTVPGLDLGSYLDLVRDSDITRRLMIGFTMDKKLGDKKFKIYSPIKVEDPRGYGRCEVEFCFDKDRNKIEVVSFIGRTCDGKPLLCLKRDAEGKWKLEGQNRYLKNIDIEMENFIPIVVPAGEKPKNHIAEKIFGWSIASKIRSEILREQFDRLRYIAPIRERIPRQSIIGTMAYSELGPSGENLMRVLASSEIVGSKREKIIDELNYWLKTKFKLVRNVEMLSLDRSGTIKSLVAENPRGEKINLAWMGCGISQLVPVVVQTVMTPNSGCLLVEQPEIHLHPSAQADLADLFVESVRGDRQFIIETHSEHFILRLRRRIAQGRIRADRVAIFSMEKKQGVSKIKRIHLRSDGHFDEWPEGFFEEGFNEALKIAEASYRRRTKK